MENKKDKKAALNDELLGKVSGGEEEAIPRLCTYNPGMRCPGYVSCNTCNFNPEKKDE